MSEGVTFASQHLGSPVPTPTPRCLPQHVVRYTSLTPVRHLTPIKPPSCSELLRFFDCRRGLSLCRDLRQLWNVAERWWRGSGLRSLRLLRGSATLWCLNRAGPIRNCLHPARLKAGSSPALRQSDCSAPSRYDEGLCARLARRRCWQCPSSACFLIHLPFLPPCSPVWLFSRWLELSRGGDDVRAPDRGRDAEG